MSLLIPKNVRAAWAARTCRPSARCTPSDDNLGDSLMDGAAAPPAPPPTAARSRIAALRSRVSRKLDRVQLPAWAKGKKRFACGATQTDTELSPARGYQEISTRLVPEQLPLVAQHSSYFQPEEKQTVIAASAETIAKLQCEMVKMQAKLEQSARAVEVVSKLQRDLTTLQAKLLQAEHDETAARRRALRAELQELSHREHTARCDTEMEADNEWNMLVFAFQDPGTSDTNCGETTEECVNAQSTVACVALPCSTAIAQPTFPEPTSPRSPTFARECLFIDRICHWVAAFVRRDWARTCSTSAYAVFKVVFQVRDIWLSVAKPIGSFQSVGTNSAQDTHSFGPEPGVLWAARGEVMGLRQKVIATQTPDIRWAARFALHMQLTAHYYEEMRLRHRQLFQRTTYVVNDLSHVLSTLLEIQESVDARLAAAEESTDSD
eukprot:TRINITY_DN7124_c0_g1_i6.p1 TRINITY_DN7124_c0_g1~~TRINITY_DN7124_c0_g1_i6.p1  ORF type:complete len:463 (+),score=124.33 TRINITY_DN7124_c0_g1_i6:84-1391(+)